MSQQNKRGKDKKSASGDTAGVVLIIVAVFFLVCLCTPILSDIGAPIKNLLTGLFGYFAYAAFVIMLVSGVLILRKSRLLVQKKWAAYAILSFLFFVCVLQLITSSKYLGQSIGEYISTVYDHGEAKTIGGIVFGIFVFAAKAALSKVGAYLFFSLLLALFLFLLGYDIYRTQKPVPQNRRNYKAGQPSRSGKQPQQPHAGRFVRSGTEVTPLRPVQNQGLFVGNIVPKDERATSESGSFSGFVNQPQEKASPDSIKKLNNYFATIKQEKESQTEPESQRINARQVLFEDRQRMSEQSARDFLSKSNQHKEMARDILSQAATMKPIMPPKSSAQPDIQKERPEDIAVGFVKSEPKLPEVVFPPPKDVEPNFVDGEIIDGAVVSNQLKRMDKPKRFEPDYRSLVDEDYGFEPEDDKANDFLSQSHGQSYSHGNFGREDNFGSESVDDFGDFSVTRTARHVSRPDIRPEDDYQSGYNPSEIINCDDICGESQSAPPKAVEKAPAASKIEHDCYELPADLGLEDDDFVDVPKDKRDDNFDDFGADIDTEFNNDFAAADGEQVSNDVCESTDSFAQNIWGGSIKSETAAEKKQNTVVKPYIAPEKMQDTAAENTPKNTPKKTASVTFDYSNVQQEIEFEEESAQYSAPTRATAPQGSYAGDLQQLQDEELDSANDNDDNDEDGFEGEFEDGFDIEVAQPDTQRLKTDDYSAQSENFQPEKPAVTAIQSVIHQQVPQHAQHAQHTQHVSQQKSAQLQPVASITAQNSDENTMTSAVGADDIQPEEDYTGHYIKQKKTEAFSKRAEELNKKIDPKNQINFESYVSQAAAQTPEPQKPKRRKIGRYLPPPVELLTSQSTDPEDYNQDFQKNATTLEETLKSLKLPAKVIGITKGPAVTRYELEMPPGYTVKKIEGFSQDIAYALASTGGIRIEAPIPGKRAVGVEVPNSSIGIVGLREMIESPEFAKSSSYLSLCVGKDIAGKPVVCSLDKMPHLLVAGSTGSGKSACLHSLIISMLFKSSPSDLRLILIDPKRVEFPFYKGLRHLMINNIINEREHAINAFKWVREEMTERYRLLAKHNSRNLQEYNSCAAVKSGEAEKLPSIVIIVDELSDLMQGGYKKEMEEHILSIAQLARASGVHLILATQRPSVDVITGTIKVNLPSRIALAVSNAMDSKTILDQSGAEMLLGRGDLLYAPIDAPDAKRIQGAYVTKEEVESIVDFINDNNPEDFYDEAEEKIMRSKEVEEESGEADKDEDEGYDPLMEEIARKVIETNQASTSMMQRRFKLGYARASRIMDQMERFSFIGPMDPARPTKPREVFITRDMFKDFFGKDY